MWTFLIVHPLWFSTLNLLVGPTCIGVKVGHLPSKDNVHFYSKFSVCMVLSSFSCLLRLGDRKQRGSIGTQVKKTTILVSVPRISLGCFALGKERITIKSQSFVCSFQKEFCLLGVFKLQSSYFFIITLCCIFFHMHSFSCVCWWFGHLRELTASSLASVIGYASGGSANHDDNISRWQCADSEL